MYSNVLRRPPMLGKPRVAQHQRVARLGQTSDASFAQIIRGLRSVHTYKVIRGLRSVNLLLYIHVLGDNCCPLETFLVKFLKHFPCHGA